MSPIKECGIEYPESLHSPTPAEFFDRDVPIRQLVESGLLAQGFFIELELE
jgi:hypothetical protein